ncbi:adenine phosphoribosyltransferase [bacterium]|nr:adenine phosphoribosyltransferase [bacterium]
MLKNKLIKCFDSYQDFPKEGILFRDVLPVLARPDLLEELTKEMANLEMVKNSDAIVGIDARGFLFGMAAALIAKKPLILARKPGKLPGDLITESYELEYGKNTLCIQKKSIDDFNKFCIIDDLLATGGTAACVEKMLFNNGKSITGLAVIVELSSLNGRNKLNSNVSAQVSF